MTKDMTQGSPLKLLLAFAVPLMLGSLFQQFYPIFCRHKKGHPKVYLRQPCLFYVQM